MALNIHAHRPLNHTYSYDVEFNGEFIYATVTNQPGTVAEWIWDIRERHRRELHHLVIGLTVHCDPSGSRVATLELCVGQSCLIYQIMQCQSIPSRLMRFLSKRYLVFVGVEIHSHLQMLQRDYGIGFETMAVDLRDFAADSYHRDELRQAALSQLTRVVLQADVGIPAWVAQSRWDSRVLSASQVKYSCAAVFACFQVGREC